MDGMPSRSHQWSAWIVLVAFVTIIGGGYLIWARHQPVTASKSAPVKHVAIVQRGGPTNHVDPPARAKHKIARARKHEPRVPRVAVYVDGKRYVATPAPLRHKRA